MTSTDTYRLGEIPLATILKRAVQRAFVERDDPISIVDVTLGYEPRCAAPIPFDIDYTRTLGHRAVKFLLSEPDDELLRFGGMVCLESGYLTGHHGLTRARPRYKLYVAEPFSFNASN